MAKKKIGKVLLCSALIGSAVAGGMALYRKYKASSDDFDDDFLDFDDDDFDDDDFDDFNSNYEDFDDDEDDEVENDEAAANETEDASSDDDSKSKSYVSIPLDDNFIDGIDNIPENSEE
ncbi:MAG: hypothetical protein K2M60_09275 [Lachnospiraceae bacterium]|nr:hypothetical protein [Lachnospiraceae bacterium]MDE6253766.1 hypothetical protein [Lachnospiraceae bacterium]